MARMRSVVPHLVEFVRSVTNRELAAPRSPSGAGTDSSVVEGGGRGGDGLSYVISAATGVGRPRQIVLTHPQFWR
jgi:hypothetical protein